MKSYWPPYPPSGYDRKMSEAPQTLPIVAFVRDLMFTSRISATARAKNAPVAIVKDPARLPATAGRLLLVDLGERGAIDSAVAWKHAHGGRVIAFASHVDTATIAAARQAGLDQVLARGAFVGQLESILENG